MKLNDFLTMHKAHAIVMTVGEYPKIKDKILKFYTNKNIERLDEFCKESWNDKKFLLCNPYLTAQIITPLMLENAVTFVDRTPLRNIEIEEDQTMTQEEVALSAMKTLDIYKPYIKQFEKDGTITLFEGFGGYYITEDNEPELLKKIKEFEAEYGSIVYAVTHTFTQFGELYEFLCISKYEEEWKDTLEDIKEGYAFSYVWNKTDERCSEFGTIAVKSFGGGIRRVG